MKNLTVLISGSGTNLQAIIDASIKFTPNTLNDPSPLNVRINGVISNKPNVQGLERATQANIPAHEVIWDKTVENRDQYDSRLADIVLEQMKEPTDIIILAGFMHILGPIFLSKMERRNIPVINLHPALPGQFPGAHAIRDAYYAFKRGEVKFTGVMAHHVVEEIDAGQTITQAIVPIYHQDSIETLRNRIHFHEKAVLLQAIQTVLATQDSPSEARPRLVNKGKVRDVWDLGYNTMALVHSDRVSSFDRHICDVPNKGSILNMTSAYWFKRTKHLMPNHFLDAHKNVMIVKKCKVYPVEVVVRAYITGSTKTSLWTHYNNGERTYCGITFPDNLVKNQKLDQLVITPTTKGETDEPLSAEEIVESNLISQEEWDQISYQALNLFNYASQHAASRGLILVDTKLEFGYEPNNPGKLLLVDEIFTCDSSRYWKMDTYQQRFDAGEEPECLDKDQVRHWVKSQCDPYNDPIPEPPSELINKVSEAYQSFYDQLTGELDRFQMIHQVSNDPAEIFEYYFNNLHNKTVIILSESDADEKHARKIQKALQEFDIYSTWLTCSAHTETERLLLLLETFRDQISDGRKLVFCCISQHSDTLGSITSSNIPVPVVSCPNLDNPSNVNLNYSSISHPKNVPISTILEPDNVANHISKIFQMF